jgi:hypothetical protein
MQCTEGFVILGAHVLHRSSPSSRSTTCESNTSASHSPACLLWCTPKARVCKPVQHSVEHTASLVLVHHDPACTSFTVPTYPPPSCCLNRYLPTNVASMSEGGALLQATAAIALSADGQSAASAYGLMPFGNGSAAATVGRWVMQLVQNSSWPA